MNITEDIAKEDRFALPIHKQVYTRPVMAVLVSDIIIFSLRNQMFGPRIRLLAEANKEVNHILYYFSLHQVRLKERKITGYYWYSQYNRWLHQEFSFPDILYIRGGIDKRNTQTFAELCDIINKNNGRVINHQRFNKWRLYQILNKDPAIKSYLPVTRTVKQPVDIKKMLQEYKVVYLKSHLGRKGENVLRVEVLTDGNYRYSYFKNDYLTVHTVFGFQALLNSIKDFFNDKRFLIQQAIQLISYQNRLIDMRAELQRNGEGSLEVAGISVRLGQPGSPVTTHGDAFRFDNFFVNKMGYSKGTMDAFRSAVHQFLFSVYECIEKNYSDYVEIGIDFAIDTNGKIWFIEANSYSAKVSLIKAYGEAVLFRNYKNILEYTRYLYERAQRGINHEDKLR